MGVNRQLMARRTRVITDMNSQIGEAVRGLTRIGHDHVNGFLAGGLASWETNGR